MSQKHLSEQSVNRFDVDETDLAHLAGVIDAIGTISVYVSKDDNYSIGYQYQPAIRVLRPSKDDDILMGKLMAYADEQGVRHSISEKSHGPDRDSKSYEFFCKKPESIRRFLEPLLPHLTVQYEKAVLMLEQIVPRMEDGLHTKKDSFLEMMDLADAIREGNTKGGPPKYTRDYFEEEWSIAE